MAKIEKVSRKLRLAMKRLRNGVPMKHPSRVNFRRVLSARVMSNIERPWNKGEALTINLKDS